MSNAEEQKLAKVQEHLAKLSTHNQGYIRSLGELLFRFHQSHPNAADQELSRVIHKSVFHASNKYLDVLGDGKVLLMGLMYNHKWWKWMAKEEWGLRWFDFNTQEVLLGFFREIKNQPMETLRACVVAQKGSRIENQTEEAAQIASEWYSEHWYPLYTQKIGTKALQLTSILSYTTKLPGLLSPPPFFPSSKLDNPGLWRGQGHLMDDEDAVLYSFTATHAGAFTKLCRQGPGLYRSIWHLIGIKLWVVWPSTSYNDNETRNCAEKEFSIRWAIKHLHDAEVYFCNEPCSFIISPNSWYSNLSFMPSVHFSSLFIQSDKLDDMAKNTKTWAENLRHRDACQTWSPEGWQQARESVQESYDLCTKLAAETDNYESLYKWIGLCVEEHENPFRKQFQSSAMSNKDAVLEDQPGGVSPARRKRDGEEEEEGIWTPRKRTKAQ